MKLFYVNIVVLGFLTLGSFQASESGVEVRPHGEVLIEIEPKRIVTIEFQVTNWMSERMEFEAEVKLPKDWILITEDFPFEIDSHASEIKLVSFFIPKNSPEGKYEVTYRVRGREHRSVSDFFTIYVHVVAIQKLKETGPDSENQE